MLSISELNFIISDLVFLKETTFYVVKREKHKSTSKKL